MPPGVSFSGDVAVKFLVSSDGTVERFERLTPLADGTAPVGTVQRFDERLKASIRACAFEPGRDAKGTPADIWLVLPIRFAKPWP